MDIAESNHTKSVRATTKDKSVADNDYYTFLRARGARISEALKERVIRIDRDAERQAVSNDDTEDTSTGFE
jgi:hypothetical protein